MNIRPAHEIRLGDALTVLRSMESESVQCCVTSPPYFGLRDYGTAEWDISNAEDAEIAGKCDHSGVARRCDKEGRTDKQSSQKGSSSDRVSRTCLKCGAVRVDAQIGLEATPAEFVSRLVDVFEEVRRVLKKDGTLWLNLGDSYAGSWGAMSYAGGDIAARRFGGDGEKIARPNTSRLTGHLKAKDLIGIPWRVAFALQEAGWWLRQDIIWHKPNPMPESVTDRCTKAHEYMFLLTKSAKYFYDAEAVKEPCETNENRSFGIVRDREFDYDSNVAVIRPNGRGGQDAIRTLNRRDNGQTDGFTDFGMYSGRAGDPVDGTRNKRSVWTVTTQPYSEAHFATFPPKLIEPCILAGSREGDTVLDPFNGSGTTGLVSLRHRRNYIGIELNPEYIKIAEKRLSDVQVKLF